MNNDNIIVIASVEQEFMAVSAVEALKNEGIPAAYKPKTDAGAFALPGAYGIPELFEISVNEDDIEKARDVLIGIGCIEPDDAENGETTDESVEEENGEEERQPQTLAELFPENPWLAAVYKVLLAAIVLAFLIGFVWLCDTVIAWVMSLFM